MISLLYFLYGKLINYNTTLVSTRRTNFMAWEILSWNSLVKFRAEIKRVSSLKENNFLLRRHYLLTNIWNCNGAKKCSDVCLVMVYMVVQVYEQSELMYYLNIYKYLLENWKRYLDDCVNLWTYPLEKPIDLKTYNQQHEYWY